MNVKSFSQFIVNRTLNRFMSSSKDIEALISCETGGRLELQTWMQTENMSMEEMEKDQYLRKQKLEEEIKQLEQMEMQGRIGFLYNRK